MSNRLLQLGLHFQTEQLNYNILRKVMGLRMYKIWKTGKQNMPVINKTKRKEVKHFTAKGFLFHLLSGSLQIKRILQSDRWFFFGNNAILPSWTLKLPVSWGESKPDFEIACVASVSNRVIARKLVPSFPSPSPVILFFFALVLHFFFALVPTF